MSFAWNLKTARTQAGLTQGELAQKVGVSQKTLSSWETGRTDPSIEETIKLCNALDCTIEALTGTKMRSIGEISFEDILVKLKDLDYSHLKELRNTIEMIVTQRQELERIKMQREEQLARIRQYEEEIDRLTKELNSGGLK